MSLPDFETLLQGSAREHGHMCAGQVIGVRMALLGLKLIGLDNPRETGEIKKLIVFVEIDRCATDAIAYVTGVKLGRRSLKFKDYGLMAATFVNLETHKAVRIVSTETARDNAEHFAPELKTKEEKQVMAYKQMDLNQLFDVFEVKVNLSDSEFPGPSAFKAICDACGTLIRDRKELTSNGKVLCHFCAGRAYYQAPVRVSI